MESVIAALAGAPIGERLLVIVSDAACLASIALVAARPSTFSFVTRGYGARLVKPWRLVTFVVSAAVFTFGAPYMGDPTWDYAVGALMSVLTYLLAPWSAGTLYRFVRGVGEGEGRAMKKALFVALAGWLLAASGSYETYLAFRDGRLPPTAWSNLVTSSAAFFAAGLFWSLTYARGRGVVFSFMLDDWPHGAEERRMSPRMVLVAALIATVVGLVLLPFVLQMR